MKGSIRHAMLIALAPMLIGAGQGPSERRGPTSSDIVRTLGDEAGAGGMMARTIANKLRSKSPLTVFVLAEQVRPEWLPLGAGVQYVLLDQEQARKHIQSCGEYLFVRAVTRNGSNAAVSVGQGNRCRSFGITSSFQLGVSGWDAIPGIGGVFGGSVIHCDCR